MFRIGHFLIINGTVDVKMEARISNTFVNVDNGNLKSRFVISRS